MEEAGLEIENKKKLLEDFTFVRPDRINVVGMCFEVTAKSEDVKIPKDFDDFKWVTPEEFSKLDFPVRLTPQLAATTLIS